MKPIYQRFLCTLSLLTLLAFPYSCADKDECADCGGTLFEGYLFKEVTEQDLAQLGTIEGINIGVCIRYRLSGEEFDTETIAIVDDCCCE